MSAKSGSLVNYVCAQLGPRRLFVIWSNGVSAIQGCLIIEVNGRTVGTFRIVRYVVGVCCWGVSVKRGSTVIPAALNLLHSPLLNEQNLYNVHNLPVPSCSEHKGVDSAILLAVSCPDHTYERWSGSHTTSYEFFNKAWGISRMSPDPLLAVGGGEGCWGFPISQACLRVDLLKDAAGSQFGKCVFRWICWRMLGVPH